MISNIEEAKELCAKYGIKFSEHDTVIVTGNNSIYLSDNIDPNDKSEKFYLKGQTISISVAGTEITKEQFEAQIGMKVEDVKELSDEDMASIKSQISQEEKDSKSKK